MTINIKTAKVRDNPDLVRDMDTKAILANDHDKYNDHKQKKDLLKKLIAQGNEFESLKKFAPARKIKFPMKGLHPS